MVYGKASYFVGTGEACRSDICLCFSEAGRPRTHLYVYAPLVFCWHKRLSVVLRSFAFLLFFCHIFEHASRPVCTPPTRELLLL